MFCIWSIDSVKGFKGGNIVSSQFSLTITVLSLENVLGSTCLNYNMSAAKKRHGYRQQLPRARRELTVSVFEIFGKRKEVVHLMNRFR